MEDLKSELTAWIDEIKAHKSPDWDNLPSIDLYMDQVTVLMEKYLDVFMLDRSDKLISPSMINNYVKLGLILPPVKKKYSRKHMAYLMAVCILKQVLPISDITDLINNQMGKIEIEELFNIFSAEQDKALSATADIVLENTKNASDTDIEKNLNLLALKLTVTANANKLAAERIIYLLKNKEKRCEKDDNSKK